MTDVKTSVNPLFLREEELRQGIELLYFAYRDFTAEPDELLAEYTARSISSGATPACRSATCWRR